MQKYLVLSDIHLGDPRFNQDDLLIDLLTKEDYDVLVLDGDITDSWIEQDINQIVCDHLPLNVFLKKLLKKKSIIWVVGNHDHSRSQIETFLPGVSIVDQIAFITRYGSCLVVHGHKAESFYTFIPHWFSKINAFIFTLTHGRIDIERIFRTWLGIYPWLLKRRIDAFVKKFSGVYAKAIIGHTHIGGVRNYPDMTIYDLGQWLTDTNYILIDYDKIEYKRWR